MSFFCVHELIVGHALFLLFKKGRILRLFLFYFLYSYKIKIQYKKSFNQNKFQYCNNNSHLWLKNWTRCIYPWTSKRHEYYPPEITRSRLPPPLNNFLPAFRAITRILHNRDSWIFGQLPAKTVNRETSLIRYLVCSFVGPLRLLPPPLAR